MCSLGCRAGSRERLSSRSCSTTSWTRARFRLTGSWSARNRSRQRRKPSRRYSLRRRKRKKSSSDWRMSNARSLKRHRRVLVLESSLKRQS